MSRLALFYSVPEVDIHIIQPIAAQLLTKIIYELGYKDVMKNNVHLLSDSRMTSKHIDENNNPNLVIDRVIARLTPNLNPSNNKWEGYKTQIDLGNGNTLITGNRPGANAVKKPWDPSNINAIFPVFHDADSCTDLTEWVTGTSFSMEVSMEFTESNLANEALSRLYQTYNNGEMINATDLVYDYPIPAAIVNTLYYISTLLHIDKSNFLAWLREQSKDAISLLMNRERRDDTEFIIQKNQKDAIFQIECSQETPTMGDNSAIFQFTVHCQFARVNQLILEYPVSINNQMVSFNFVPMNEEKRTANTGACQWQNKAVNEYWKLLNQQTHIVQPIHFPWWDDWLLPRDARIYKRNFRPVFVGVITLDNIDDPDAVTTINLETDIPGYSFIDEFITELKSLKEKALDVYNGINVSVFADDVQVDNSLLTLTDGVTLTIANKLPYRVYRVVVCTCQQPVQKPRQVFNVLRCCLRVKRG